MDHNTIITLHLNVCNLRRLLVNNHSCMNTQGCLSSPFVQHIMKSILKYDPLRIQRDNLHNTHTGLYIIYQDVSRLTYNGPAVTRLAWS